jgi:hypothetical protein
MISINMSIICSRSSSNNCSSNSNAFRSIISISSRVVVVIVVLVVLIVEEVIVVKILALAALVKIEEPCLFLTHISSKYQSSEILIFTVTENTNSGLHFKCLITARRVITCNCEQTVSILHALSFMFSFS